MASSGTYLNLTLPNVGSTLGPAWATTLNDAFIDLDDHDHSAQGKNIPSSGLNINANLDFNNYGATEVKNIQFQGSAQTFSTEVGLYVDGSNDLVFFDGGSQQILASGTGTTAGGSTKYVRVADANATVTIANNTGATFFSSTYAGSTGTTQTIKLPDTAQIPAGRFFIIKDTQGNANTRNRIIDGYSTQNIDGDLTKTITVNFGYLTVVSDGTNWNMINDKLS